MVTGDVVTGSNLESVPNPHSTKHGNEFKGTLIVAAGGITLLAVMAFAFFSERPHSNVQNLSALIEADRAQGTMGERIAADLGIPIESRTDQSNAIHPFLAVEP